MLSAMLSAMLSMRREGLNPPGIGPSFNKLRGRVQGRPLWNDSVPLGRIKGARAGRHTGTRPTASSDRGL